MKVFGYLLLQFVFLPLGCGLAAASPDANENETQRTDKTLASELPAVQSSRELRAAINGYVNELCKNDIVLQEARTKAIDASRILLRAIAVHPNLQEEQKARLEAIRGLAAIAKIEDKQKVSEAEKARREAEAALSRKAKQLPDIQQLIRARDQARNDFLRLRNEAFGKSDRGKELLKREAALIRGIPSIEPNL